MASIGGIVRDSLGDLIMALFISVNMDESLAAEFGVKWCYHHGYTDFILEIDSIIIAKMLNSNLGTNLKLKQVIDTINIIKNRVGFQVSHCFREGNQLADYLAKMASFSAQSLLT
ncbi:hypothetical protein KY285_016414 [Solanum tuberosum]|nr:hypothetical protein KY284_018576 [Solanum tuberosum]KAH0702136.1 hypothetical protein KY285_016414 [Solanum tuberosum]